MIILLIKMNSTEQNNLINNPDISKSYNDRITELINERNYSDIKLGLIGRSGWKLTGDICETLGHILVGIASILAFLAGGLNIQYLSFISGSISIGAILFLKFSSYAMKESKERTEIINRILTKMGINTIVDISFDSTVNNLDRTIVQPNKKSSITPPDVPIIEV